MSTGVGATGGCEKPNVSAMGTDLWSSAKIVCIHNHGASSPALHTIFLQCDTCHDDHVVSADGKILKRFRRILVSLLLTGMVIR